MRPEIVRRLVELPRVGGDRMDALVDSTPEERAAAARILHDRTLELLREAGVVPPRAGTVLDLQWRQAAAIAAVVGTVGGTWRSPLYVGRRLEDVLKVADPRAARWCLQVLAWARLLPGEPAP